MHKYQLIAESPSAMRSLHSVLDHNGIDHSAMSLEDKVDTARTYSAPCHHKFDLSADPKKCIRCGGLR